MKIYRKASFLVLMTVLLSNFAHATIIDFDDVDLSSGFNGTRSNFDLLGIANTYEGFQWQGSNAGQPWAAASQADSQFAVLGAAHSGEQYGWNWNGGLTNSILFGQATDVAGAWFRDLWDTQNFQASTLALVGYDENDVEIGSVSLDINQNWQYLNAGFSRVFRLEFLANNGQGGSAWYAVDSIDLSSAQIPEPSSLLILALGLFALGARRVKP